MHLCNRYGNTALHLASDRGFADCARLLLEAGAAVDMKNNDGATALQVSGPSLTERALPPAPALTAPLHPLAPGRAPLTAPPSPPCLQCACITGHRDCVTLALDYGADILAQYYGRTALDWAEAEGRARITTHTSTRTRTRTLT